MLVNYIKQFKDIYKNEVLEVGGKGAALGELYNGGLPVPPGFVITANAFREFAEKGILGELGKEIFEAFDQLETNRVAVRSSAIAEDSNSASWAGQLESYLNVSKDNLIENIQNCWDSIETDRALDYADSQNTNKADLVVAVVVQQMVAAEGAGVMFTINPVSKNDDEVIIEACFGLGELLVQGMITPDDYLINKNSLEIISKELGSQTEMLVFKDGRNQEVPVPEDLISEFVLTDSQLEELVELGKKIESHYNSPQDIEWAREKGKFYIVQSRPITA